MAGVQPTSLISDHLVTLSFFNIQSNFRKPTSSALRFSVRASDSAQRQKSRSRPANDSKRRIRVVAPPDKMQNLNLDVSTHRAVAAVRLMRIELGGAYADLLNDKEKDSLKSEMSYVERTLGFSTKDLENRDFRLVTEIVGGTIRWKRYLDYLILSLIHDERTFTRMEPLLLQILRIGCYELVKLEMPPHAVVNENVNLAKVALRPGAGNMVNGILRKLASLKESNTVPVPRLDGNDRTQARALATIYSHPVWMVRRWTKFMGLEAAIKLMMWNNSDPCFSLRANAGRGFSRSDLINQLNALEVVHDPSSSLDDFVRIRTGMQNVIQAGLLQEGLCSVQDESAGLAVSVVDSQPGDIIVDCCAAPGGKTLFMASRLSGQGMIYSVDINEGRLRILKETAKSQQVDDVVTVIHADLRSLECIDNVKPDKVLLDAPCSGLGVLSKRADLRWNRSLEDMEELRKLQDELLDSASKLVKPGGVLVYSTCSIDPTENEDRIAAFLERHQEFQVDPVDRYIPLDFVTKLGFFRSCPVKHSMDGAFAARLIRKS
ncbi:hypothetical protein V2J09_015192 [Rumex salicifolius]